MRSHPQIYDTIGKQYVGQRIPDPRIAQQIRRALDGAITVCNIGAGTGSYEPADLMVTAVEPSSTMISQRTSSFPVKCASAENLPFADQEFDAAMTVLSIHHWIDAKKGLNEMKRVARRQVVLTFDPLRLDDLWLIKDYIPEVVEFELGRAPSIEFIVDNLKSSHVESVPIASDCTDGFQAAFWRRPHRYLDPEVQASISSFAQLPVAVVGSAMSRLRADLESRRWHERYASLVNRESMDLGYRLIIGESGKTRSS